MRSAAFLVGVFAAGCSAEMGAIGSVGPAPPPEPTGHERPLVRDLTTDVRPPSHDGYVSIHTTERTREAGEGSELYVSAKAWFGPIAEPARTPIRGCEYKRTDELWGANIEEPRSDSAGSVVVDVMLGAEKRALKLPFDETEGRYESYWNDADGHANGVVRVRASGGIVPAFDVSVAALSPIQVISPARGSKVGARDLIVSWTSAEDDASSLVWVSLLTGTVQCSVGKVERDVVVPEALMTTLLAGGGEEEVELMVWTGRRNQIDAGDYRIGVSHNSSTYINLPRE